MFTEVPEKSLILKNFEEYDYCDSFQVNYCTKESVDQITNKVLTLPKWAVLLFRLRNFAAKFFGLKTGDAKDVKYLDYYPVGSRAVVFEVIDRNENEIVMAEDDKHLKFRASILLNKTEDKTIVHLTTIVKFNNLGGKLYFVPVKPFHKMIIKSILKRLVNETES